ncbi:MAG: hypothetical protein HY593_04005, partial [Candidatus Omnitrophica bacterium]|nr:hypothetical protein [Candidatus Omnitrophota bacterium]
KEKNPFFYGTALVVSFLTVYYSFRMLFVLIFSKTNRLSSITHHEPPIGDHASDHTVGAALGRPLGAAFLAGSPGFPPAPHQSPALEYCKAIPLVSLALLSLYAGALGTPIMGHKILHWLGGHAGHLNTELLATTSLLILAGIGLAYLQFRNPEKAEQALERNRSLLKRVLERKFFMDDAYDFLVHNIVVPLTSGLNRFDHGVITGIMVNKTAAGVMRLGKLLSRLQNGFLQNYLSIAIGTGVVVVFYLVHWKQ